MPLALAAYASISRRLQEKKNQTRQLHSSLMSMDVLVHHMAIACGVYRRHTGLPNAPPDPPVRPHSLIQDRFAVCEQDFGIVRPKPQRDLIRPGGRLHDGSPPGGSAGFASAALRTCQTTSLQSASVCPQASQTVSQNARSGRSSPGQAQTLWRYRA